eukprot:617675_1
MGGGIERTDTSIKIQEQSAGPSLCVEGSETVEVESEPASCTSTRGHQFTESEIEHIHKMRKRYPRPSWPSMHEGMRSTFPNFRADNVSASSLQMKYSRLMRGKTTVGGRPQTGRQSRISDEQEQSVEPSLCPEGNETVEVESEPTSSLSTRGHLFTAAEIQHIHKLRKADTRPTWKSIYEEMRSTFPDFRSDNVSFHALQKITRVIRGKTRVGVVTQPGRPSRISD